MLWLTVLSINHILRLYSIKGREFSTLVIAVFESRCSAWFSSISVNVFYAFTTLKLQLQKVLCLLFFFPLKKLSTLPEMIFPLLFLAPSSSIPILCLICLVNYSSFNAQCKASRAIWKDFSDFLCHVCPAPTPICQNFHLSSPSAPRTYSG